MLATRIIASFSAGLALMFAGITLWLATNGQASERSLWYGIASGVGFLLGIVFIRAAIKGKLPAWFEAFLDAQ